MTTTRRLPITQNTDLATFSIVINGQPLQQSIPVFSVVVHREVNRIPTAMISLADGDAGTGQWAVSSGDLFVPGNEVEILAGYQNENESIFKGIVTKQALRVRSQRLELEVECKDKAVRMTEVRHSRQFLDQKDSDLIPAILQENELNGEIADTTVTHPEMIQYHCTDWDFINCRLEASGLVCVTADGSVNGIKPELANEAIATLAFGGNIYEFDAEIDARRQYQSVAALGWDSASQAIAQADAADPGWTTVGNLAPDDLAQAVGAQEFNLLHPGRLSTDELQSWADATLLRSRMAFVRGRARIQGFAKAVPGATLTLEGLGDRFNGPVWVSGVRHEISTGNWQSDVQFGLANTHHAEQYNVAAPAAGALLAAISGLHTGVVTQLESDPDSEFRIRVKIPSVDPDGEGIWARIATLDAGDNRGTFFLPEVDDEVLVGFLNDDPRQPVVLGQLHSSAKAAPLEAADANPEKGYVSRSGMKLIFNDEKVSVTLETPAGNKFSIDEDSGEVMLVDSNGNKIVFSSSGIAIESAKDLTLKAAGDLKLEGQVNLQAKAGAQFKAEGSAGLEISSSAITTVKGSLVQIN